MAPPGARTFQKYLLPGLVFQAVLTGGGYGTGREIIEYFLAYGPVGGLLGMLVTVAVWVLILAVTFEYARRFRTFDYRTLVRHLLGPAWIGFEIFYLVMLVIVMAVVGSASGTLLRDSFGVPYAAGVALMLGVVSFLTFKGSGLLEKAFSAWSIYLSSFYVLFVAVALVRFGPAIRESFGAAQLGPGWALGGFKYSLYNLVAIPAVLFCARHLETRREALVAGVLAAPIGLAPALLFFIGVSGHYPAILEQEIPAMFVAEQARAPWLVALYVVMLFGTLIDTGAGLIHGVNERIDASLRSRGAALARWQRAIIAGAFTLVSLALSALGIVTLVARGYGLMSWALFAVYVLPLLTIGVYQLTAGQPPISPRGSRA